MAGHVHLLFLKNHSLHCYFCLDVRMGIVALEQEVLKLEVEDVLYIGVNLHDGQWTGLARELETGLLEMVQIEMGVACGVDEISGHHVADLCHHLEQQRIGGDVEGYTEEGIS